MTKYLFFFQYTVTLTVELKLGGETFLWDGVQASAVDVLLPGDKRLLRFDQLGEKTLVITFPVKHGNGAYRQFR